MFTLTRLTIQRARKERLPQVAGSLTFTTLLSIVPLLAASFALLTRFPILYGAFAALPMFLLWVYFSWLVTLVAAMMTANLALTRRRAAGKVQN